MDRPHGLIVDMHPDAAPPCAVVEVLSVVRCPRCAAGKGCGAGLLDGGNAPRRIDALLPDDLDLRRGDRVWLELAPADLLQAAITAYGTPLLGMLLAAGSAYLGGLGDLQAVALTLSGALAGAAIARYRLRRRDCLQSMTPRITGRKPAAAG